MKRLTLTDVAEVAGVATSTASRALANPERVNPRTRELVERAAQEIGYRHPRDARERAMAEISSAAVATIVSDTANPFFYDVIRGAQRQLRAAGHSQMLVDTEESGDIEWSSLQSARRGCVGAIVVASRLPDASLTSIAAEFPLVVVNRRPAGVTSVVVDTPSGVRQAVAHLASLGHTRILYVAGPDYSWSSDRRWNASREAGEELGVHVERVGPFGPTLSAGVEAADLAIDRGVTAVIAFNDLLAIGVLDQFQRRGVSVPDDVSVVGCDDILGSNFCHPRLTTISAPVEQVGRAAVSLLLAVLRGVRDARTAVLPTQLVVRDSTARPR